jgi:hypothetical protein
LETLPFQGKSLQISSFENPNLQKNASASRDNPLTPFAIIDFQVFPEDQVSG